MKSYRPARIAELLREEISQIINYELADRRIRPAAVTCLKVSSDLRHARVYVTLLGTREDVEQTIRGLNRAAGFIRSQLYPRVTMRVVPELVFHYDDTLEKVAQVDKLFAEKSGESNE